MCIVLYGADSVRFFLFGFFSFSFHLVLLFSVLYLVGGATLMTTQKTAVLIHSHQLDFLKNFKIRFAGIVFHGLRVRMG